MTFAEEVVKLRSECRYLRQENARLKRQNQLLTEELNNQIAGLKDQLTDPAQDKLSIEQFLNLSKNAGVIVQSADAIIKDKICREIFLNFTVNEENVLSHQLKEPFDTLLKQRKILSSRGDKN